MSVRESLVRTLGLGRHTETAAGAGTEMAPPILLTADETASLLRTTRTAVYAMAARGQLPGTTRIGRRVLFRSAALLHWLDQNRAPSPKEEWR